MKVSAKADYAVRAAAELAAAQPQGGLVRAEAIATAQAIPLRFLENILSDSEDTLIAQGAPDEVIDGRVAFQTNTQDEFTAAIERLTHRRVVAFLSANQTSPGVASELFFLDAAPLQDPR